MMKKVAALTGIKDDVLVRGIVNITSDMPVESKLMQFQQRFLYARGNWNYDILDEREEIYDGTHAVDQNVNSKTAPSKMSNNVYNITYELIESEVDNTIPLPSVQSKRSEYQTLARGIGDSLKNDIVDTRINKVNDKNERVTYKHGWSMVELIWNSDFHHPLYEGEMEILARHPKVFIPQPGVYELDDMDYYFVMASVTKQYIFQKYGVDLPNQTEQYPEINYIGDATYSNAQLEKVTEITAWYRDEDGDIGKFVWVMNTPLEDFPKVYYRRPEKCDKCDNVRDPMNQGETCDCGGKFKRKIEYYEEITEDIMLDRMESIVDPMTGIPTEQPVVIPRGTKIPYFIPKDYPHVVRVNVPSDFSFGGVSDVDVIRDQQDAIKKLVNNIEEKILRGGYVILASDDHKFTLTNQLYQIIRGNPQQLQLLDVKSLTADIQKEIETVQMMYQFAQNTLGITDSWQGKPDTTAMSGRAKQIQVQQAGGRLQSKWLNKQDFYRRLYERMFHFKLAFYDELRPYVVKDAFGEDRYADFNKYDFLMKGKDGGWYYMTDFTFEATVGDGVPKDPMWVMESSINLHGQGAFEATEPNLILWGQFESIQYPGAGEVKKALQANLEKAQAIEQQQMEAQQGMVAPEEGVPPEEAGGEQLTPDILAQAFPDADPEMVKEAMAQVAQEGGGGNAVQVGSPT